MGALDDPAAGAATPAATARLLPNLKHMGPIASGPDHFSRRPATVGFVRTQMLRTATRGFGPANDDRIQGGRQQLHVMPVDPA